MKYRKPSRILNDRSVFMGLDFQDLLGLGICLMLLQSILKIWHLEFFALILTILIGIGLSPIRLKFRRKIIRDALFYYFGPRAIRNRK